MWIDALNAMKKQSGKTTEQISEESGIPKGTLNKIFAGQTKDPKYQTLRTLVHCLGFTIDDLEEKKAPESEQTDPGESITQEQLVSVLNTLGFLDENGQLSDADMKFLNSVIALLDEWFNG